MGAHPLAGWLAVGVARRRGGSGRRQDGSPVFSKPSLANRIAKKKPQIPSCDTLMFLVRASWREPEGKKKKKEKLGGRGVGNGGGA